MGKKIKTWDFLRISELIDKGLQNINIMVETGFSIETVKRIRMAKEFIDHDDFDGLRSAYMYEQITGSIYFIASDILNSKPKFKTEPEPEPEQMELEYVQGTLECINNEKIESLLEQIVRSQWAIVEQLKKVGEKI